MFKAKSTEDLELLYSILREEYPTKQIDVTFNYNTKEYTLVVSAKPYVSDPNVPLDLNIEVVYGDSVTGDTPLLLRDPSTQQVMIKTVDDMCDDWTDYPEFKLFDQSVRLEKQYGTTPLEVWCDKGWNPIRKVIRHKTDKQLMRILTHTGVVDVTEDHSLCKPNLEKVKPSELQIGQPLLHSFPDEWNVDPNNDMSHERAYIYGFFFGDGSCGTYEYESGLKHSWALNNADIELLKKLQDYMEQCYPAIKPKIYNTMASSGVYKLSVSSKALVEEFRQQFYDKRKYKKVPVDIMNAPSNIIRSFLDGYWAADGSTVERIGCSRFDMKGKIGGLGIYSLLKKVGYNVSLNTRHDKPDIYRVTFTKSGVPDTQRKVSNVVKKIDNLGRSTDYVYDLETECGRFNAGVGQLTCFNTDSIFLRFKYNRQDFESNRADTFRLATLCGNKLTKEVFARPPIEMEFEKVFQPFILLTKKRYIAQKYENIQDPFKLKGLDAKGIALTRRDYCKMVKTCYKEIIDTIMDTSKSDSVARSIAVFKRYIDKIDKYDIDMSDLVVSAMLAKSYKTKPVHVMLAEKLKLRKEEVQVGDRIPYIYVETNDPKQAKSELGEDPQYAKKNGLKFNRKCYLEQLAKPILGFYKIVLKEDGELLDSILNHVNQRLVSYGAKALKPSEFKIED